MLILVPSFTACQARHERRPFLTWKSFDLHRPAHHCSCLTIALLSGPAGWWLFIDSVVRAKLVLDQSFPDIFLVPGLIATFAALLMASFRRSSIDDSDDDGQVRNSNTTVCCYAARSATAIPSVYRFQWSSILAVLAALQPAIWNVLCKHASTVFHSWWWQCHPSLVSPAHKQQPLPSGTSRTKAVACASITTHAQ